MARVLVIEDDPDLRTLLRVTLTGAGHTTVEAGDGLAGLRAFHQHPADLVLLDIGLPTLNGWEVLKRIREISEVPVILVSTQWRESEKIRGLDGGGDDYVTKPFGRGELLARCNAHLRRHSANRDNVNVIGDRRLRIDTKRRTVHLDGEALVLTAHEYRVLLTLVRHADTPVSHVELLAQAWGDASGIAPERVKFVVLRLRRKLGRGGYQPLSCIRGLGYIWRTDKTPVTGEAAHRGPPEP